MAQGIHFCNYVHFWPVKPSHPTKPEPCRTERTVLQYSKNTVQSWRTPDIKRDEYENVSGAQESVWSVSSLSRRAVTAGDDIMQSGGVARRLRTSRAQDARPRDKRHPTRGCTAVRRGQALRRRGQSDAGVWRVFNSRWIRRASVHFWWVAEGTFPSFVLKLKNNNYLNYIDELKKIQNLLKMTNTTKLFVHVEFVR